MLMIKQTTKKIFNIDHDGKEDSLDVRSLPQSQSHPQQPPARLIDNDVDMVIICHYNGLHFDAIG